MRNYAQILGIAGVVLVPCAAGKTIRLLSVFVNVSGTADGDEVSVEIQSEGSAVARVATSGLTAGTNTVTFAVGVGTVNPVVLSQTLGVNTFATIENATSALPNLEFKTEVRLVVSSIVASLDRIAVLYGTD